MDIIQLVRENFKVENDTIIEEVHISDLRFVTLKYLRLSNQLEKIESNSDLNDIISISFNFDSDYIVENLKVVDVVSFLNGL